MQIQLFDFVETPNWDIEYPDIPPFSAGQQLELERELLGLYLSGHPLDDYDAALDVPGVDRLMDLAEAADESQTIVAAMVISVKTITTKQGKAMAFMEVEDQIERCEVVLFPEVWRRCSQHVGKGALLALRAKVQQQDEGFKLLAEDVLPLDEAALAQLARRSRAKSAPAKSYSRPERKPAPAPGEPRTAAPLRTTYRLYRGRGKPLRSAYSSKLRRRRSRIPTCLSA